MAINNLMNKSFLTRAISGACLVAILLATFILGGDVCFSVISVASIIGLTEIYNTVGIKKNVVGIVGYISAIAYLCIIRFFGTEHITTFVIGFLLVIMTTYVFSFPKYKTEKILMAFFGVIYVVIMMSFIYFVRMTPNGIYTVWLIFICAWGSDTCAYLVGVTCGKHKMAPILSPKKSIEGAIGGVVGAALLSGLYGFIISEQLAGVSNAVLIFAIVGAVSALISMVGDLAASAIKRDYEIKDYGKLIPGHGGILDRFDSIIFTAPIIYYLLVYIK